MKTKPYMVLGIFVTGFVLLLIGIYRGAVSIVLQKAINVCLECVGIG